MIDEIRNTEGDARGQPHTIYLQKQKDPIAIHQSCNDCFYNWI